MPTRIEGCGRQHASDKPANRTTCMIEGLYWYLALIRWAGVIHPLSTDYD